MGEWWYGETGLPLPLGGNVIRKDLGPELMAQVSRHLRGSIAYGLAHRSQALDHAMQFARGLERRKADTFVGMYVNEWTLDYGERGRQRYTSFSGAASRAGWYRDRRRWSLQTKGRWTSDPPRYSRFPAGVLIA